MQSHAAEPHLVKQRHGYGDMRRTTFNEHSPVRLLLARPIHVTLLQLCHAAGKLPLSWLDPAHERTYDTLPSVCWHVFPNQHMSAG